MKRVKVLDKNFTGQKECPEENCLQVTNQQT
jgi:hypothetical protein